MGRETGIAWTDHTWNPWQGCHKVSAGCAFCYMYRDKTRYGQDPAVVVRSAPATFNFPARRGKSGPKPGDRVFTASWSDFFIAEADAWRADAWAVIKRCPDLTFQILTKRPERVAACLPADWGDGWPNVWIGTSIENQRAAETRIGALLGVPARVRFLSCEPLLGPLDIRPWLVLPGRPLGWVIVGGESGPKARPCALPALRRVVQDCAAAGVACFVKQMGDAPTDDAGAPVPLTARAGADPAEWPEDLRVQNFPEVTP